MRTSGIIASIFCFALAACSGDATTKVASAQKRDKSLSCSEVQLEINEAEFYRKQARTNKSPNFSTLISPISYISTYMDADDAEHAADDRIDYLNRIYEINRCDQQPVQATYPMPQQAQPMPMPVVQYIPEKPQMMPPQMIPQQQLYSQQMMPQGQIIAIPQMPTAPMELDEVPEQTSANEYGQPQYGQPQPYRVAQYMPMQMSYPAGYAPITQEQYLLYYY